MIPTSQFIKVVPSERYYWDTKYGNAVAGLKMIIGALRPARLCRVHLVVSDRLDSSVSECTRIVDIEKMPAFESVKRARQSVRARDRSRSAHAKQGTPKNQRYRDWPKRSICGAGKERQGQVSHNFFM